MFPSLSQVSILNQHYHFKHDRSKRNLQQALLPRERDTETEKTPQTHNPMQTPTQPAQELCCCHQRRSVRRDIYTAPGLTEKTFLLCREIPPAAFPECYSSPLVPLSPCPATPEGMGVFQGVAGDRDSHHLPKRSLQPLPGQTHPSGRERAAVG